MSVQVELHGGVVRLVVSLCWLIRIAVLSTWRQVYPQLGCSFIRTAAAGRALTSQCRRKRTSSYTIRCVATHFVYTGRAEVQWLVCRGYSVGLGIDASVGHLSDMLFEAMFTPAAAEHMTDHDSVPFTW